MQSFFSVGQSRHYSDGNIRKAEPVEVEAEVENPRIGVAHP